MKKSALFAIIILFAVNILNFYDRNVAGAVVEPMRKEFHLTDTQIGLLGTAFTLLYAIIGVPLGRIADMSGAEEAAGAGRAGVERAHGVHLLRRELRDADDFETRRGRGRGDVRADGYQLARRSGACHAKRARVLGLFMLGVPVGGALSYFFSGPVAHAYGWRMAMVAAAAPALLLIPALLMLHEPERGASETHRETVHTGSMWRVLKIPTLWWIIASGALLNFNMYAIGTFMPAMFGRIYHD